MTPPDMLVHTGFIPREFVEAAAAHIARTEQPLLVYRAHRYGCTLHTKPTAESPQGYSAELFNPDFDYPRTLRHAFDERAAHTPPEEVFLAVGPRLPTILEQWFPILAVCSDSGTLPGPGHGGWPAEASRAEWLRAAFEAHGRDEPLPCGVPQDILEAWLDGPIDHLWGSCYEVDLLGDPASDAFHMLNKLNLPARFVTSGDDAGQFDLGQFGLDPETGIFGAYRSASLSSPLAVSCLQWVLDDLESGIRIELCTRECVHA